VTATVRITDLIDGRRLGAFQFTVAALCALIGFTEGFDINSAGYFAPALAKALSLKHGALGLFFSTGLFGLMLGGLFIAPIADHIGRKPVLIGSLILYGLASLAASTSTSLLMLEPLWFLVGLGVGGAMPNSIALTAEYVPQRSRSLIVTMTFNGFIAGSLAAGLTAAHLIKAMGWSSVLIVGGALPLILTPIVLLFLPESTRFLAMRPAHQTKVAALMRRIDRTQPVTGVLYAADHSPERVSVAALFGAGRGARTLLLWTMVFFSFFVMFLMSSWLPTQVASLGVSVVLAIAIGALLQLGGMAGTVLGWALDRFGPGLTLALAYLFGACAIAGIGLVGKNVPLLALCVLAAGFGVLGAQSASNAVAATSYPTEIRSTGVGWFFGIGRIGSIIGPSTAAVLLSSGVSNRNVFLLAVIPALCAAAAALGLQFTKPILTEPRSSR